MTILFKYTLSGHTHTYAHSNKRQLKKEKTRIPKSIGTLIYNSPQKYFLLPHRLLFFSSTYSLYAFSSICFSFVNFNK